MTALKGTLPAPVPALPVVADASNPSPTVPNVPKCTVNVLVLAALELQVPIHVQRIEVPTLSLFLGIVISEITTSVSTVFIPAVPVPV